MRAHAAPLIAAALVGLLCFPAVGAATPQLGHFSGVTPLGPDVITDLPCLDGKAFTFTGAVSSRGTFLNDVDFFHFTGIEQFSATLVPVDGQGPTYVEGGNTQHVDFTARAVPAGVEIVTSDINNDQFIGYVDGRRVASATIRIRERTHLVGVDSDGDGQIDQFKSSVTIDRVSCPA
jgi:hypothetical protein